MRKLLTATLVCCTIVGLASATEAEAMMRKPTNIPAQALRPALHLLSKERDVQVVYRTDVVADLRTQGAAGELTFEEALKQLLAGTALTYQYLDEKTVTIVPLAVVTSTQNGLDEQGAGAWASAAASDNVAAAGDEASTAKERKGLWDRWRVAQAAEQKYSAEAGETDAGSRNEKLEEIVVTAQRREETLQDVPISIAVFSGEELDAATGSGVVEALQRVPGVDSTTGLYEGGTVQYTVRGVSTGANASYGAGAGPVAFYLDGVPYGFLRNSVYPDPSVYDLEQIEFLSGPQGTLYGAGSLNGVVRVLTHDANADEFEFKARASVSGIEDGGTNTGGDFAVNVPIIDGVLGVRAAVGFRNDAGWIDTYNPNNGLYPDSSNPLYRADPPAPRHDVNTDEARSYRLKVHAQPNPTLAIDLTAWRFEDEIGAPLTWSAEDRTVRTLQDQTQNQEFTTYSARVAQEFSGFTLTSTTSYIDFSNGGDVSGEPIPVPVVLQSAWTSEVISQEFNLVSDDDGPWSWSAGAFYRDVEESRYTRYHWLINLGDFDNDNYGDDSESYAVFGELARDLTDDLELAVGLRYFHDSQTLTLFQQYSNGASGITLPAGSKFDSTFRSLTPRVILTWTPGDNHMLYASYGQGFRSGLAQQPNVQVVAPGYTPLEPDLLTNYEVGAKGDLFEGGVSYEAALFYIDWQDVQQSTPVTIPPGNIATTAVLNVGDASGVGASFALRARPAEGLEIGGSVAWNDLTSDQDFTTLGVTIRKGERLNFSPEYTVNADVQYEWGFGGDFQGIFALSGLYRSVQTGRTFVGTTAKSESQYQGNVSFTLETPFNVDAKLFIDNFTDVNRTTAPGLYVDWEPRSRPRVFGVQLAYQFK